MHNIIKKREKAKKEGKGAKIQRELQYKQKNQTLKKSIMIAKQDGE